MRVAVDVDPTVRGADVVVARDVGVDAPAVARAVHLVVLEHGGNDAFEDPLERDRLHVVGVEREPDAPHRLEHLVVHRPDRGGVAVGAELAARAHRPLLGAARHAGVRIHHAAVRVLAEPEPERERAVARGGHRADLLGPGSIGLRHGRERVDDLVGEQLVERTERSEISHDVTTARSQM